MVRRFQPSDITKFRQYIEAARGEISDTDEELIDYAQNNVTFYQDSPESFCTVSYYEIPKGILPFSGMCSQVTALHGNFTNLNQPMVLLANALYTMGQENPDALDKPVFARFDTSLVDQFKVPFNANVDNRLIWLPTLREAIKKSERYR